LLLHSCVCHSPPRHRVSFREPLRRAPLARRRNHTGYLMHSSCQHLTPPESASALAMSRDGAHLDNGPRYFTSPAGNGFRLALSREGRLGSAWRNRTSFAMRVGAHRGAHQAHQYATSCIPNWRSRAIRFSEVIGTHQAISLGRNGTGASV
jgi:hypothetical protein